MMIMPQTYLILIDTLPEVSMKAEAYVNKLSMICRSYCAFILSTYDRNIKRRGQ
jgi:hypothetical protein